MKKKVLHILNSSIYSGAENVVITIIKNIKKKNINYQFIFVSRKGSIESALIENDITYELVDKMSICEIRKIVKKYQPDIIHAHDFTASIVSAMSMVRVPIICHLHNNPPWIKQYGWKTILYGLSTNKYKTILGVSKAIFNEYVFTKFIKSKSYVIGNPNDIEKIRNLADEVIIDNNFKFEIVFIGRLTKQKNPIRFVDIVQGVQKQIPHVCAATIGTGEMENEVKEYIIKKGLEGNIEMCGFQKNPYSILKYAKALCLTSEWEGYGLVAIEAMSLGVPVVASPVGGIVDIITEESGQLCKTDEEFINEIINILKNENYFQKKSLGALKRSNELNNIDEYINNIRYYYDINA